MSDQKKILHDDSNGLDYVLVEDYYLPMIDFQDYGKSISLVRKIQERRQYF